MNKDLFKKYADIKNQIKDLTKEAKGIETEVKDEMDKNDVEQVKSDFGTFSKIVRLSWTYSKYILSFEEAVKGRIEELKEAQKQEQENGRAKSKETTGLMFRGK